MLNKILYSIHIALILILLVGVFANLLSNSINFYISFALVLLGFIIYPEKKDFGTKTGMLLFPLLAVIIFNFSLLFYTDNFPRGVIFINALFSVFCFTVSYFYKKRNSTEEEN